MPNPNHLQNTSPFSSWCYRTSHSTYWKLNRVVLHGTNILLRLILVPGFLSIADVSSFSLSLSLSRILFLSLTLAFSLFLSLSRRHFETILKAGGGGVNFSILLCPGKFWFWDFQTRLESPKTDKQFFSLGTDFAKSEKVLNCCQSVVKLRCGGRMKMLLLAEIVDRMPLVIDGSIKSTLHRTQ